MNLFGMGPMEIAVIMIVALIIFGPGKLPEIGGQVGRAMRDFRRATRDLTAEFQDSIDDVQATIGEMKATVADVRDETAALASSIPASLDVNQSPGAAAPKALPTTENGTAAVAVAAQTEPVAVASKDDPLADLTLLDDDLLSAGDEKAG